MLSVLGCCWGLTSCPVMSPASSVGSSLGVPAKPRNCGEIDQLSRLKAVVFCVLDVSNGYYHEYRCVVSQCF